MSGYGSEGSGPDRDESPWFVAPGDEPVDDASGDPGGGRPDEAVGDRDGDGTYGSVGDRRADRADDRVDVIGAASPFADDTATATAATDPAGDPSGAQSSGLQLTAEEARVLGCLVEKERTVPDTYPMTLKGIVTACNQSSSRWPVVAYDSGTVQRTLDGLKVAGLVRFIHPAHGERMTKFRHVLDERLQLDRAEAALVAVLLLRGAQTVAELRTRTERQHAFASTTEVETALAGLAARPEPLVVAIGRRPGEREGRWAHRFGGGDDHPSSGDAATRRASGGTAPSADPDVVAGLDERIARLEAQVAHLYELLGEVPVDPDLGAHPPPEPA